ncbi:TPA: hypothetical protein QB650_000491 [Pasteurella multocida]|uniref:hypothetical protein n=1 Tax=Pasteurella multocida TaxID=747 RepID=UPI00292D1B55|nr:hypothetical protein [Pasteurella multocida]WNY74888.1 hypothetical protein H2512_04180 [Pasteurella multocida]HDR1906707.1 hypothetical protein [Pasteurella multocida]
MKYIEKSIEDQQTGANAAYHEIVSLNIDYLNNSISATVASFVSKQTKESEKKALSFNSFYLNSVPERSESAHDWVLNQLVLKQPEDYQHDGQSVNPYMFAGGQVKND